jgi:hypothetical protein
MFESIPCLKTHLAIQEALDGKVVEWIEKRATNNTGNEEYQCRIVRVGTKDRRDTRSAPITP